MQQASSREMEGAAAAGGGGGGSGSGSGGNGMNSMLSHSHSQMSTMEELHHQQQQQQHHHHHHHNTNNNHQNQNQNQNQNGHYHHDSQNSHHDDFLEQMLSTIPNCSWPPNPPSHDLSSPSNPNPNPNPNNSNNINPIPPIKSSADSPSNDPSNPDFHYPFEDSSSSLASKLRIHHSHINGAAKSLLLQQQLLLSRGAAAARSPSAVAADSGLLPFPLSLAASGDSVDSRLLAADRSQTDVPADPSPFKSPAPQGAGDANVQALYNGFTGSLQTPNQQQQQQFHHHPPPQGGAMPGQSFGGQAATMSQGQGQVPPASASTGGSSGAAPQRQRVRARRGQATDPHSIAERLRRERIAERMKALQELVPNANKTDKASMLDEIIDYVKFLQLQVKVLSMSRLGGAAAVAPLVADISSEGGGGGMRGGGNNGNQTGSTNDTMTVTEHQVAKLMEEDMGSAMQYLQGKGLCLMPISLATAISTATCHSRPPTRPLLNDIINTTTTSNNHHHHHPLAVAANSNATEAAPTSPNMSGLTVQSATLANVSLDPSSSSVKDTKPSNP